MLQFGKALPHAAKENSFGIVVDLKLANEPSLSTVKFLHGAAERTHLVLTFPLRFAIERPDVMLEEFSSLGAKYSLA